MITTRYTKPLSFMYTGGMWQDPVIAVCQFGAVIALQFIIWSKDKPSFTSAVLNVIFPAIISFALFTLELYYATTTAALITLSWAIICVQIMQKRSKVKKSS